MRNIFLLLSCLTANGLALDCQYANNCNPEDGSIFEIKCPSDAAAACECASGTCDPDPTTLTSADVNADACKTYCTGDCKFYKWIQDDFYHGGAKHCYAMTGEQCDGYGGKPCNDIDHCVSGALDDVCDGNNTPKPDPVAEACSVEGLVYDKSGEKLHWLCDTVDPYAVGTKKVATGTICIAHHPCADYVDNAGSDYQLAFECDAISDVAGEWKSLREDDYLDVVTETVQDQDGNDVKQLREPVCNTQPLEVPKANYDQSGLLISCTTANAIDVSGDPVTITASTNPEQAPTTCLFMCDYYPILSFYPGWVPEDDTGVRGWLYTMEDGITDPDVGGNGVLNPENIKCWD